MSWHHYLGPGKSTVKWKHNSSCKHAQKWSTDNYPDNKIAKNIMERVLLFKTVIVQYQSVKKQRNKYSYALCVKISSYSLNKESVCGHCECVSYIVHMYCLRIIIKTIMNKKRGLTDAIARR